jgi:hypothetical protein
VPVARLGLLLAVLTWAGCSSEPLDSGYCARDEDCPSGIHCVIGTGVCVGFRNPLDAGVPDLSEADLSTLDFATAD